jgi:hypothetical protein
MIGNRDKIVEAWYEHCGTMITTSLRAAYGFFSSSGLHLRRGCSFVFRAVIGTLISAKRGG